MRVSEGKYTKEVQVIFAMTVKKSRTKYKKTSCLCSKDMYDTLIITPI